MNASVDMAAFTAPRSDQINYEDFVGGPRTILITSVRANEGAKDQPISIHYEGDNGKPFKPCLSMRRVMTYVWGRDASQYPGRSMTLYGDPSVIWGGMAVGGVRISHMSHIDKPQTMALSASKTKRAPFTVQPLAVADVESLIAQYVAVKDQAGFDAAETARGNVWKSLSKDDKAALKAASDEAKERAQEATL